MYDNIASDVAVF